jgi:hypothetical protein
MQQKVEPCKIDENIYLIDVNMLVMVKITRANVFRIA